MTDHNETTVEAVAKEMARHKIVAQGSLSRSHDWSGKYVACKCSGATEQDSMGAYIKADEYHLHVAEAALAAIPEPATVGGVTREQIAGAITGGICCDSPSHELPIGAYQNIGAQEIERAADQVLALFPPALPSQVSSSGANETVDTKIPAPSTVGTVEVRHFAPYGATNALCDEMVPRGVAWDAAAGEYGTQRFTVRRDRATCPECAHQLRILTPATTRDVGALTDEQVLAALTFTVLEPPTSFDPDPYVRPATYREQADAIIDMLTAAGITVVRAASAKGGGK